MTVLQVIKDVTKDVGLAEPSSVYGSNDREQIELAALANEMAERIAHDGHDWTDLKALATITGDGVTTEFALPDDFRRMLKTGSLYSSTMPFNPLVHIKDADEWLSYEVQSFSTLVNRWTIIGGEISIKPAPAAASTVKYYYVSKLIVAPATGVNKAAFTIDSDGFRLDERVLKLGMIWKWLDNKGRPYAEKLEDYETALAARIGEDRGPAIITVGRQRLPADVRTAYPWTIVG